MTTGDVRIDAHTSGLIVNARLLILRLDGWHVCGVFQLRRDEFEALALMAVGNGIEVDFEVGARP